MRLGLSVALSHLLPVTPPVTVHGVSVIATVPSAEAPSGDAVDVLAGVVAADFTVLICVHVAEPYDIAAMAMGGSATDDAASATKAVSAEEAETWDPITGVAKAVTRLAAAGGAAAAAPVHVDGRNADLRRRGIRECHTQG